MGDVQEGTALFGLRSRQDQNSPLSCARCVLFWWRT